MSHAQEYFQQHVAYRIEVALDDAAHMLRGHLHLHYTNNSPDTLTGIYMHLYPNAYSTKHTAFARQMVALGDKNFALAGEWEMGGIDSLDFHVDQQAIPWMLDKDHPDIALLHLRNPLAPGQTVEVTTPFRVRIPRSFSRLGRAATSYQISQWYPKPAVYDHAGWHPMPYLDQGEFYSEFGTYDVRITLPENYVIAATGTLQTVQEHRWLDSLAQVKNAPLVGFPPSSRAVKTVRFTASDVHDFAWFADKRFAVRRQEVEVAGRNIPCWAFFTAFDQSFWEDAAGYIADALQFYSEHVGPYPYDHMTAVQAPASAGRGMEYPMITLIGNVIGPEDLDQVITHEVGHNWFYAILASNERAHPWMDEGLNTLYEYWYFLEKYGMRGDQLMLRFFDREENTSDPQRLLRYYHRMHRPISPGDAPVDQNLREYTLAAYYKPALTLWMLNAYLGNDLFRQGMQAYFDKWKFSHPGPEEFFTTFEDACGCQLEWLRELILTGALPDYRLIGADTEQQTLTISNHNGVPAPVQIVAYGSDSKSHAMWIDGFKGDTTVSFELAGVTKVQLYESAFSLDATPDDNTLYLERPVGRRLRPEVRLLGGVPNTGKIPVNILPLAAWNDYDKRMLGVALTNLQWPSAKTRWLAIPLFATNTRSLTGLAMVEHKSGIAEGIFESISVKARMKSFHYYHNFDYDFFDRYVRSDLAFTGRLRRTAPLSSITHDLRYRAVYVRQSYGQGLNIAEGLWRRERRDYWVHELQYRRGDRGVLAPSELVLSTHAGKGFLRVAADFDQKFSFRRGSKGVFLHAFAGWLPYLERPDANVLFHFNGIPSVGFSARDYTYDELLLARNTVNGFFGQQVFLKDARLKTLDRSGLTDNWMVAAGLATDTPLPIPVQPYFDMTVYADPVDGNVAVSYSGGLALVVKKHVLEVFFPLVESKDIRTSLTYVERKSVFQRMSILLELTALNPFDAVDRRLE